MISVRLVTAEQVWPLRQLVLRPGRPISEAIFQGDALPTTSHWGAFSESGEILAVTSLFRAAQPGTSALAWQVRGMASHPLARGRGYGAAVLRECIKYVSSNDSDAVIWCNARIAAVDFYRSFGFVIVGEQFEIPIVGPHYVMWRKALALP